MGRLTVNTKVCKRCKEEKSLDKFTKSKNSKGGRTAKCTKCIYECYRKNKTEEKREKEKFYRYRYLYGLDKETYDKLLEDIGEKCMICQNHFSNLQTGLCIDHDHKTGKVRGILCGDCNRGLGMFKDKIVNLNNAVQYLLKYGNN
jgi:hypothetical protein